MRKVAVFFTLFICLTMLHPPVMALDSKEGAPVTIEVSPALALRGHPVTLSGNTTTDGKRFDVVLEIARAGDNKKFEIKAKADEKGDFKAEFKQTEKVGKYTVTASAPDGAGKGTAEFEVADPVGLGNMAVETFETVAKTVEAKTITLEGMLEDLPSSDERDKLLEQAGELKSQMEKIGSAATGMTPALKEMMAVLDLPAEQLADTAAEELLGELADWNDEAQVKMAELEKLLPDGPQAPNVCDMIHTAAEGLRLASLILDFYARGLPILVNLAVDKGIPMVLQQYYPERQPTWDAASKTAANSARGVSDLLAGAVGVTNDLATLVVDNLMDRYCGVYSGPIDATMSGTFRNFGSEYWKYSLRIEGWFVLRFPYTANPNAPVRLTGEIFGNATQYTFWEDVEKVMEVPRGGQIVVRRPITPGPFPRLYKDPLGLGQIANLALPPVFYIPMEGMMEDDVVALKLMDPVKDVSDFLLKNQLIMAYMAYGLPVPAVKHFEFPMQGAHFILTRGMRQPAQIDISTQGNSRLMKKQFTRTWESDDGEITIEWVVNLDAALQPGK